MSAPGREMREEREEERERKERGTRARDESDTVHRVHALCDPGRIPCAFAPGPTAALHATPSATSTNPSAALVYTAPRYFMGEVLVST